MILAYTLSFTLLVTSVIKVADVFLKTDKSLSEKRIQFIKKTQSLHKKSNQDGNITLMAALLTLMISALLMFFALKFKVELKEARYRKDSYLCFYSMNIEVENYIKDMALFNLSLRTLFAAQFTGIYTAQAKLAFDTMTLVRNARHFYYIKNFISNKYCANKIETFSYLKNFPFKLTPALTLQTNIDETTTLRGPQWTVTYYKSPAGIRLKNSFCLKAQFKADGAFFPKLKIKTSEVSMEGFSKLKCWSGSP